ADVVARPQGGYHLRHGAHDLPPVVRGSRRAHFLEHAPAIVDHDPEDLGAPDIEAYGLAPHAALDCRRPAGASAGGLVPEQRSDGAEHVEVGIANANLHIARLQQRFLHSFLDHVVDAVHGTLAHRAATPDAADVVARGAPPAG